MVIAYHEIGPDEASYIYSVTSKQLASHLKVIAELGTNARAATRAVSVTFDDGHVSHYEHALPQLQKYGIKAAFCATAAWIDKQPAYMSARQLRELISLGHQVYAHGWSHKMLTACSPSELYHELFQSKRILENLLGAPVEAMSVPHGRWNNRVLQMCAAAGYRNVYTSEPHIGPVLRSGVCLTGRLMMTRTLSANAFEGLLNSPGKANHLSKLKCTAKRIVRIAIGDERYRALWRVAGSRKEPLPNSECSQQPLRILHLISSAGFYGAESMLLNLAKSLEAGGSRNVIGVFRNARNPNTEIAERAEENHLTTEIIACRRRVDMSSIQEIKNIIYKHGIDLVHTHGCKANVYGLLAAAPVRVPLVATCHMAWPDRSVALRAYHSLDRLVLRGFQKVVSVSAAIEASLLRCGLNAKKLITVANGIDLAPFRIDQAQRGLEVPTDQVTIGIVGRLIPVKGHRYLLEAARELLMEFPNIQFLFVGDGPERQALNRMVSMLGLDSRVIFAGKQRDMPAVYASIDILVLPSLSEGMPMTLIEAMVAGRPVIASRVGDIPKLVKHGETGLLVEPGSPEALKQAISQLLSDPALRSELALQGQQWASEQFSAGTMARRYQDVYRDILLNRSSLAS